MLVECGGKARVRVSKREFYTHIHLDQVRVEILFCIYKKKITNRNYFTIFLQTIDVTNFLLVFI